MEKKVITLKTDYSPVAAPEKQEKDNVRMIQMLLIFSGMPEKARDIYNTITHNGAIAYTRELTSNPGPEQWEAAKDAIKPYLANAEDVLIKYGVTIKNALTLSEESGYFSHITTTVFNDYEKMNPVARIERAVTDIEAETYDDNQTGYGAHHALS